jgi:hypothetical protein
LSSRELQCKLDELSKAESDIMNLLSRPLIAAIIVDR